MSTCLLDFLTTPHRLDKAEQVEALGYTPAKMLTNGEWAGVHDYHYTASISVGIDACGWRTRYCYETRQLAEAALLIWDGIGDPPGPWIKQKPEDRHGPWYEDPFA